MIDPGKEIYRHSWQASELDGLIEDADLKGRGLRVKRMKRADALAVASALHCETATAGALSSDGDRTGVIIALNYLGDDCWAQFADQVAGGVFGGAAVQQFAHLGGSPMFYYLAKVLGIRGYSTCLLTSGGWSGGSDTATTDVLASGIVGTLLLVELTLGERVLELSDDERPFLAGEDAVSATVLTTDSPSITREIHGSA